MPSSRRPEATPPEAAQLGSWHAPTAEPWPAEAAPADPWLPDHGEHAPASPWLPDHGEHAPAGTASPQPWPSGATAEPWPADSGELWPSDTVSSQSWPAGGDGQWPADGDGVWPTQTASAQPRQPAEDAELWPPRDAGLWLTETAPPGSWRPEAAAPGTTSQEFWPASPAAVETDPQPSTAVPADRAGRSVALAPGLQPGRRAGRRASRPGRTRRPGARPRLVISTLIVALVVVAALLTASVHTVRLPDGRTSVTGAWVVLRYLIYGSWLLPLGELILLALGQLNFRLRFRAAAPGTFRHLIIQITTTGGEQRRVNEVIAQIRSYRLTMSYEVWVVTEPGMDDHYPQADLVLRVPPSFTARSERKARALEFSRRTRQHLGYGRPDVKILFNDDDVAPTKRYIEQAFSADYDICEGITAPRAEYAVRPLGHFLSSHADDMRTHGCLVYCSVFQGILGQPLHVHGEGLTVTGAAEALVTWDWPAVASEDLIFGRKAAAAGLRWGWFHEYVELTSPWSLRDFITQRRRWLWGDIHAITHREVLSLPAAMAIAVKYLVGLVALVFSVAGLYLTVTGRLPHTPVTYGVAKLALLSWLAVFFGCGWIGASSRVSARNDDSRLLNAVAAVVMAPLSSLLTLVGIVLPLMLGDSGTFQVIRKTRGQAP